MGLQIKTYTGPSIIHGIGLFAAEYLKKGTILWKYEINIEKRERISELSPEVIEKMLHYGYINPLQPEYIVVCGDEARYWNFPVKGNLANSIPSKEIENGEYVILAAKEIHINEELLIDPSSDFDYKRKLCLED